MVKRTSFRLTDKRKLLFDRAEELLMAPDDTDIPRSDIIEAALVHLLESKENIEDARTEYDPETIQDIANTSVLKLHYRTSVDSPWRK